jgi:hypothetical protein
MKKERRERHEKTSTTRYYVSMVTEGRVRIFTTGGLFFE